MASTAARQVTATLSSVAQGSRLQAAPAAAARPSTSGRTSRAPLTVRAVAAPVREAETRTLSQQASAAAAAASAAAASVAAAATGRVVLESEDELRSTWEHRGWVGGATLLMAATLAQGLGQVDSAGDVAVVGAAAMAAYGLSDLGTGEPSPWPGEAAVLKPWPAACSSSLPLVCSAPLGCMPQCQSLLSDASSRAVNPVQCFHPHAAFYHFFVDNYGDGSTPVFGGQIAAFQGHHQRPWTITEREFCNNVHKVGCGCGFAAWTAAAREAVKGQSGGPASQYCCCRWCWMW